MLLCMESIKLVGPSRCWVWGCFPPDTPSWVGGGWRTCGSQEREGGLFFTHQNTNLGRLCMGRFSQHPKSRSPRWAAPGNPREEKSLETQPWGRGIWAPTTGQLQADLTRGRPTPQGPPLPPGAVQAEQSFSFPPCQAHFSLRALAVSA